MAGKQQDLTSTEEPSEADFPKDRAELLSQVRSHLEKSSPVPSPPHVCVIGPIGMGKTWLLNTIRPNFPEKRWVSIDLTRGSYQVATIRDLVETVFDKLLGRVKSLGADRSKLVSSSEPLRSKAVIPASSNGESTELTELIIGCSTLCAQAGLRVLVTIDDIDVFVERRRRYEKGVTFLQELLGQDWLRVLCSASAKIASKSLACFFRTEELRPLSIEEQLQVMTELAHDAGDFVLDRQLVHWEARLKALNHFTGGSPRLLVMFFEILSKEKSDEQTANELTLLLEKMTPFYEEIMTARSPQEVKVLHALARQQYCTGEALLGATHINKASLRVVLSRLVRDGLIVRCSGSGRGAYSIPDGFLRLWLQVNKEEHLRQPLEQALQFLVVWYGRKTGLSPTEFRGPAAAKGETRKELRAQLEFVCLPLKDTVAGGEFDAIFELLDSGRIDVVERRLTKLDRRLADDAEYHMRKGLLLSARLNRHTWAAATFRKILALEPNNLQGLYNRAVALDRDNQSAKAEEAYRRVLRALVPAVVPGKVQEQLLYVLINDPRSLNSQIAANLLGYYGSPAASLSITSEFFRSTEAWRQQNYILALGVIRAVFATDLLKSLLEATDASFSRGAARALGKIGEKSSLEALASLLRRKGPVVAIDRRRASSLDLARAEAASAIGKIDPMAGSEDLAAALFDVSPKVRASAIDAIVLSDRCESCVERFGDLLKSDPSAWVRGRAAVAIGHVEPERNADLMVLKIEFLLRALKRERSAYVREKVVNALGRAETEDAASALCSVLHKKSRQPDNVMCALSVAITRNSGLVGKDDFVLAVRTMLTLAEMRAQAKMPAIAQMALCHSVKSHNPRKIDLGIKEITQVAGQHPELEAMWRPYEIALKHINNKRDPEVIECQPPGHREVARLVISENWPEALPLDTRPVAFESPLH